MRCKVIVDIDAIRSPLTGIGRYAYELVKGLRHHPRVSSMRLMSGGRWAEFPLIGEPTQARPDASIDTGALKTRLARIPAVMAAYRALSSSLVWYRTRSASDHLYHSPNYFLPPFDGVSLATIHDLSVVRYPQFHPAERVALFDVELPKTFARAQHLITDSEAVRREVITHFGWPEARITAIPLGVDDCFHPHEPSVIAPCLADYGLTPQGYCLCVATIEPRKNIARLIDAHTALPADLRRRYPLVLVGTPGWNSAQIHARIQAAESTGTLRYLRYVEQAHLPALFAGARLFVFPSVYEGFGLPLLEAMASGIPVVTSSCPTLLELAGDIALQADAQDTDALSQAIRRGLEDDAWRLGAGEGGLRHARQFTWERCVERTLDLYTTL